MGSRDGESAIDRSGGRISGGAAEGGRTHCERRRGSGSKSGDT